MKKIICILISVVCVLFSSCAVNNYNDAESVSEMPVNTTQSTETSFEGETVRALWVNYNELSMKQEATRNEETFRKKFENIVLNAQKLKTNRLIVQVRPFSDAFYNSTVYPPTEYLSGTQGVSVPFDALLIMCEIAHNYNMKIEAWINPYRVSYKNDISLLSDSNPAKIWFEENNDTDRLFIIDKGIFYNPASSQVQKLILDGVREIVKNYNVDAIHIDDYFYPTTDENIDKQDYSEYLNSGGKLTLAQWRRENVNCFVSSLYTAVKSVNPKIEVTVSPSGDIEKNYNEHYADVALWCREQGYIDIMMPQLYYGFQNESKSFENTLNQWISLERNDNIKLVIGLAAYKCSKTDDYAASGKNEWVENSDIILRQITCVNTSGADGYALYSSFYITEENLAENAKKELQNIINMLQ